MGRSLGKGMREFKDSVSGLEATTRPTTSTTTPAELPPARLRADTVARDDGAADERERDTVS